jgi:hypothetical protein
MAAGAGASNAAAVGYPEWDRSRGSGDRRPARRQTQQRDEEDEPANYAGAFIATGCWYVVPIIGYVIWAATMSTDPRPGCVNAFGVPCPAPRAEAFTNLIDSVPQIAVALALSITVAMFLGWATTGWRAWTIGFASAVLGAGMATVIFAVLATQL